MSPGEINLKVVRERLEYVERRLEDLRGLTARTESEFLADPRNAAAAESFLRRAIEALLDAARHLLARGYGVGALEYREVARAARGKGLISAEPLAAAFERIAGFRNRLTHYYHEVTGPELFEIVNRHLADVQGLVDELRGAARRLAGGGGQGPRRL